MAYQIISRDRGTSNPIIVEDGTINKETAVSLIGKDYFGYGTDTAQNFVSLLENFATAEPALSKRITGMGWYDAPNESFKIWNGTAWLGTTLNQRTVKDENEIEHDVFIVTADGNVVSVQSSVEFVLHASETQLVAAMPSTTIGAGVNLAADMMFHGTATSALYADLAEMYASDEVYEPGTVVKLGGSAEVTQTTSALCDNVFGIVSTNPAYLMNSMIEEQAVAVALAGRVPCKVIGEVKKGQRLVSSETPGVARVASEYEYVGLDWFVVIGRALEDKTTLGVGVIEVVVGTK